MNVDKIDKEGQLAELVVKIEKADYQERVDNQVRDYRKKAQMPGFRPGKVPAGLIRKMYGKAILVEEVNKLVSEGVSDYLSTGEVNILGDPLPGDAEKQKKIDWDKDQDFEFIFDIGLQPEIEVPVSEKDKIPYYQIKTDDKKIDERIQQLQNAYGSMRDVDSVEEESMVNGHLTEQVIGEKAPVENSEALLSIKMMNEDERKKVLGKKKDERIVFDLKKAYPNDTELSSMLKVEKERLADINSEFELIIKSVVNFEKAELNKDFFDKAYPGSDIETEEDFRAKVKEEIEAASVNDSDYRFAIDARDTFISKVKMELPTEFLKRWLRETNEEDKLSDEQLDKEFPSFEKSLRWQLIVSRIMKDNQMEIKEEDLMNIARQFTAQQFRQYGMNNLPLEQLDQYAQNVLKNDDDRRRMAEKVSEDKVVKYIKETVKLDKKKVTDEEFEKLFEEDKK